MSDQDLVVNRWKRYGKDRLYVTMPDETKVGYWDLVTGEGHPESPEHLPALLYAVEGWKDEQDADGPALPSPIVASAPSAIGVPESLPTVAPAPEASAPEQPALDPVLAAAPVPRPWLDLATNQPGAEAREQAQAARDAAPVKSVLARVLGVHTDERAWRIGADGE